MMNTVNMRVYEWIGTIARENETYMLTQFQVCLYHVKHWQILICPSCMIIVISDIILTVLWIVLTVLGIVFQWKREKKRPDFPPCPYAEYKMRKARQLQEVPPPVTINQERIINERSPLLSGHGPVAKEEPLVQPLWAHTGHWVTMLLVYN